MDEQYRVSQKTLLLHFFGEKFSKIFVQNSIKIPLIGDF
jgi:hypothetical protein